MSTTNAPAPTSTELSLPVSARYVLSLLAGLLTVLNTTTVHFGANSSVYVTGALAFVAALGITPVTGSAFQTLLLKVIPARLLQPVHAILAAAIATAAVLVATAGWSTPVTSIVVAAITILAGLGFGPTGAAPLRTAALPATRIHWNRQR